MVKRKLYWALAAVIALCIGSFVLFKPKTQLDPIKIYKVTTPAPKPSFPTETNTDETEVATQHGHNPGYSHAHPHETGLHAPAAETAPSGGEYDWRDASTFEPPLPKSDPWKQTYSERQVTDETDETYPPRDWYKTEEPELRAKYFYAQLLKQFGDIPEVHVIGEHKLNIAKKAPIAIDQYIEYLEASQVLWPNEKNAELLEVLRRDKVERGK